MKVAALDLGTNTFLCLIAQGNKDGITRVHKDLMKVVRLGQEVDQRGEFHPDALIRARACLTEFKKEIQEQRVDRILAMATSAARDVRNGSELFKIGDELGIPIEIIPGEDEARITFLGATAGDLRANISSLVIDVGGGSTEFILGRDKKIIIGESVNIGGVRLTEKFISQQPVDDNEVENMNFFVQQQTFSVFEKLKKEKIDQVIAVAGTPTSIVAIEVGGFDEKKVDGFFLSKERLQYWVREFANTTVEEKKNRYGLGGRADIIFAGASIILTALVALSLPGIFVSTKGVRYGVALEMLQN